MKRLLLLVSVLCSLMAAQVFADACSDAELAQGIYNSLNQGMTLGQTLSILNCDSVRLPDQTQSPGVTVQGYQWNSPNRSITVTFRTVNGGQATLFTKDRSGLLSDVAAFSWLDNTLILPKVSVDGTATYTDARVSLPPGGIWSLLGANNGVASAADSATSTYNSTSSTLLIPAISVDGVAYANVWLHLPLTQPWSVLGVGTLTQPPLPGGISPSNTPTVTLTLTDSKTGQVLNAISNGSPALLTAVVRDASGAAVPGIVVTFSTDSEYATFTPASGTALSDANGAATVTLKASGAASGASTVTASAQLADTTVTGSLNYAVGATQITLGPLTFGSSPLSAYGTSSVSVTVLSSGSPYMTPVSVAFTSVCASSGKAVLTPSVTTVNGVATASYRDNGCNNTDAVTASVESGASVTQSLVVTPPSAGSIQFVSVVPATIALKGTGGSGRQETAMVTFRVLDNSGNPIGGRTVAFGLSTTLGGLALSSYTAVSDPVTGNVVTSVIAGTMSTSVRVTASDGALSSQSDQLSVSTGLPAQDSFSLSATEHNIEGWGYDGVKTTLTARLADHFHNPVPDGTAVYFTSEGGSVEPACVTVAGVCSVELTSQALRPTNGRVTVLARTIGEEAFTDLNSNGVVDDASEMIDANGASTDIGGEAYVDYNENGARDANEPYFDFNGDGAYNLGDGKFNGILCASGAAICSTQKSIDVRARNVIVFSTSQASITINSGAAIALNSCVPATGLGLPVTFTVTVVDTHGNSLPKDTAINFSTTNGTITSKASQIVDDRGGCRIGFAGCPVAAGSPVFGDYYVTMQSDATWTAAVGVPGDADYAPATCTDSSGANGDFSVEVVTPKQVVTPASMRVTD